MEIMEEQMIQDQIDALTMIEDLEYEQERWTFMFMLLRCSNTNEI